jgi:hypothetical protein
VDCGDYVVVTNAKDIKVTGKKEEQLVYRKHTMFPGGLKETPYKVMQQKKPEEVRRRFVPSWTYHPWSTYQPIPSRSYSTLFLACYPRTSYVTDGSSG